MSSLPGRPIDALARERPASGAEPLWPAQLAAAAALALYVTLPHTLIMGPRWLVPGVEGFLLLGLMITTPTRHHEQSPRLRALVVGLVGVVSLTTLISLILLARFLLDGSHARGHALLFAGLVLWLTNILIFGIWYWELDRGGPARRVASNDSGAPADFLFPRMTQPQLTPGWRPGFADYLYTSYTNATAFSPTDPATHRHSEAARGHPVIDRPDHDPARRRPSDERAGLRRWSLR